MGRGLGDLVEDGHGLVELGADGLHEGVPGPALNLAHLVGRRALDLVELRGAGEAFGDDPLAHLEQAVVLALPFEALLRLVALVAARGGMALGLGDLDHVQDGGHVVAAHLLGRRQVGLAERRIVPGLHRVEVEAVVALAVAETGEHLAEVLFGDLVHVVDGDAVVVVPDRHQERRPQHAHGVDRLPEHAFGAAGVADGAEGDLVAAVGKARQVPEAVELAVEARGVGEAHEAGHLGAGGRGVGRAVEDRGEVAPGAVGLEGPGGEVGVHLASGRGRIVLGVGVELGEEALEGRHAGGEHEGLVAVVAGAEVPRAKGLGHRQLGHLLAVAEDAELGLAGEHFLASDERRLAALVAESVVAENLFLAE